MNRLFSKTINTLGSLLNFHSERHKVLTSNLVNIDTPGYQPKDVVFKNELQGILGGGLKVTPVTTNENHIGPTSGAGKIEMEVVDSGAQVSLDKEMINLAENHLMYNMTVELLARKFKGLKSVLQEVK
jgi:flagellar basal-body rod protein FlgB